MRAHCRCIRNTPTCIHSPTALPGSALCGCHRHHQSRPCSITSSNVNEVSLLSECQPQSIHRDIHLEEGQRLQKRSVCGSHQFTYSSLVLGKSRVLPYRSDDKIHFSKNAHNAHSAQLQHTYNQVNASTDNTTMEGHHTLNTKPASSPPMTWSMRPYCLASSGDMYLSRSVSSSSCSQTALQH